jgi:ribosomal protein S24E
MANTTNETGYEITEGSAFKRCINGNWTVSFKTVTWDNLTTGYCPAESDCLVDPIGNYSSNYKPENYGTIKGNPQCIGNMQAVLDHYCINREWTSRTKYLANQLLAITGTNYILFCDSYTTSLNDFRFTPTIEDYLGGPIRTIPPIYKIRACTEPASALYTLPCVNNFCILSSNNKIYFGTSLDQPVNSTQNSILEALGFEINYCNGISGNTFQKCSNDNKIWYNKELNSIIYIKDGQSSMPSPSEAISSKLNPIVKYVRDEITVFGSKAYGWISAKDYNKIYFNKQGSKEIYAIYEISKNKPYLAIKYTNLGVDMCQTTSKLTGIECKQDGNSYYITSQSQAKLSIFWPQLTSTIRLQS